MEQHRYICHVGGPCVICGEVEVDGAPWLPQHEVPEGWD